MVTASSGLRSGKQARAMSSDVSLTTDGQRLLVPTCPQASPCPFQCLQAEPVLVRRDAGYEQPKIVDSPSRFQLRHQFRAFPITRSTCSSSARICTAILSNRRRKCE